MQLGVQILGDFSGLSYALFLPVVNFLPNNLDLQITLKWNGKSENIIFYRATFIDKAKRRFEWNDGYFIKKNTAKIRKASCEIQYEKMPLRSGLHLTVEFLSQSGIHSEIEYLFEDSKTVSLIGTKTYNMIADEKTYFINMINRESSAEIEASKSKETENDFTIASSRKLGSASSINQLNCTCLAPYIDALNTEIRFLIQEGGRKYKVNNGRYIGTLNTKYIYAFNLEAELYIADEAPISLTISDDDIPVRGSVLFCEDFQILLLLNKRIADKVFSARISVEPWKLLEELINRLTQHINFKEPVVEKIVVEGPNFATNEPIVNIPKGHDAVLRRAKEAPVTIVWGPPGTGKTHTMSEVAIEFLKEGKRVLVVSHSNVSVDGVAKKIYELLNEANESELYKHSAILRYGYIRDEELSQNEYISSFMCSMGLHPEKKAELEKLQKEYYEIKHKEGIDSSNFIEINEKISSIRAFIREEEQKLVSNANVIATTISKVVMDPLFDTAVYDVVIFDEVSMAYVPQIFAAATFAKEHLICVGDFMQLAPIAQSPIAKKILCEDIFTYLGINKQGTPYYHPWLIMLDEQRRMHPAISAFSNKYVYHSLLRNHDSVLTNRENIVRKLPFSGHPVNYVDLLGCYCAANKNQDNSRYNIFSAVISFAMAIEAENEMNSLPCSKGKVSIITPYVAQTRLIRALILDYRKRYETSIRCATVHQFQGSESEVVLFDAVESFPGSNVGFLMGKQPDSIKRLINVAVTRAKGKLITVGNSRFWNDYFHGHVSHTLYNLQDYSMKNGNTVSYYNSLSEEIQSFNLDDVINFYFNVQDYLDIFLQDIRNAKNKIIVSLPSGALDQSCGERISAALMQAKKKGVHILAKTNDFDALPEHWQSFTWATDNAIFPIIMIDESITWYGVPLADWKFKIDKDTAYLTRCKLAFRIKGEYTAEIIKSFSDLDLREADSSKSQLLERNDTIRIIDKENGKGAAGLAAYMQEGKYCPICKGKMKMLISSKSGKPYMKCTVKGCEGHYPYLEVFDVNNYINTNSVKCPKCGKDSLEAKKGKNGMFIVCHSCDSYIKADEV